MSDRKRSELVERLLDSSASLPVFMKTLVGTMAVTVAGTEAAGFLIGRGQGGQLELRLITHIRPDESDDEVRAAAIRAFTEIILPCAGQDKDEAIEVGSPDEGEPQYCLVTLLRNEGAAVAVAAIITRCRDQERARQRLTSVQMVAGYFELYMMRRHLREVRLHPVRTLDTVTLTALGVAVLIPVIYYGIQILCAFYNPGYSFIHQVASELGSNRAARPMLFNIGIMVQGVITLIASFGFAHATLRLGVNRTLSLLIFLALATNGIQMLWAGYFPLPDPRHAGYPPFIIAMTLLPILLTAALWKGSGAILKAYLIATLILLAAMIPITSSNIGLHAQLHHVVDTAHIKGLTQRLYTLTFFPVVAVSGIVLAQRYYRSARST